MTLGSFPGKESDLLFSTIYSFGFSFFLMEDSTGGQYNKKCVCSGCRYANQKYFYNWKEACSKPESEDAQEAYSFVEGEHVVQAALPYHSFNLDDALEVVLPEVIPAGQVTMADSNMETGAK